MRLINADVLKQHIDKLPALPDGNFAGNHSALKALINMQPTVDAVPVVRCRDCKKAEHDTIFREYWCQGREVDPDGYCSDGERKDGDHAEGTIQKERS